MLRPPGHSAPRPDGRLPYPPSKEKKAAKATGVGGVFLRAQDPAALVKWCTDVLDLEIGRGGFTVDDHIEEHEHGRFGWAFDSEGNRLELW